MGKAREGGNGVFVYPFTRFVSLLCSLLPPGAISILSWSPNGSKFACCSSTGTIQVYSGSNREYVPAIRIRELQAVAMTWSPDEQLTTLEPEGAVKVSA